jgi:hypothetical protein
MYRRIADKGGNYCTNETKIYEWVEVFKVGRMRLYGELFEMLQFCTKLVVRPRMEVHKIMYFDVRIGIYIDVMTKDVIFCIR